MKNEIINGYRIDDYILGMTYDELKAKLKNKYQIIERFNCYVLEIEDYKFWIDKEKKSLYQILVYNNYPGKFLDLIGIGSTLNDIKNFVGEYNEEFHYYILPKYRGICFELKDDEDADLQNEIEWDELNISIAFISIYFP